MSKMILRFQSTAKLAFRSSRLVALNCSMLSYPVYADVARHIFRWHHTKCIFEAYCTTDSLSFHRLLSRRTFIGKNSLDSAYIQSVAFEKSGYFTLLGLTLVAADPQRYREPCARCHPSSGTVVLPRDPEEFGNRELHYLIWRRRIRCSKCYEWVMDIQRNVNS